ncbi:thioredoxin 1 [Methanohalophilus levihalophilus]|uniref:thioredoxin n=1 Tax=Methanohalophilus levihalophilus TaxID=1431282 RepID=UPI001AEAAECF|nr:thioredoxin [Methanohalophilus levihalophilus]MBP2029619.1 thioredoxin 1 [Methanohalophilus levihalophilus]
MGLGDVVAKILGKETSAEKAVPQVEQINDNLHMINAAAFDDEVLQSELPVIVDFFSKTCGPCKKMAPVFEKMALEYDGKVKFVKIEVDKSKDLAKGYGLMAVPTLMLFKDGELQDKLIGNMPEDKVKAGLENTFGITL